MLNTLLQDEKILITGPTGRIAFPLARFLARTNEVWEVARYSAGGSRRDGFREVGRHFYPDRVR